MKKVLITGAGSYIGTAVEQWLNQEKFAGLYQTDTVDMRGNDWRNKDFSGYDTVFHVAGIAHADIGKITEEQKKLYYQVNCDLAVETARKAKAERVRQFIYMSSIIVYGEGTSIGQKRRISRDTKPSPSNFYGDSKWKAEQGLRPLSDKDFHVAILRPPMIYGKGCRGNYQTLRKIALISPVFPDFPNERSMLSIGNLCEFVRQLVERGQGGLYIPQDREYVRTAEMVRKIAEENGKKVYLVKGFNWGIHLLGRIPGKMGGMVNKAFGSLVYEWDMPKRALILASVASMISQFNMEHIRLLQDLGFTVHVACNFKEGSTCDKESIGELKKKLKADGISCYQIDFSRKMSRLGHHVKAYREVRELLEKNQYALIHCHSPIGGVIGRLAGHHAGVRTIYTAHGFHFYRGAPLKNWLIFYPVELFLSRWTEVLITINREDYQLAKKKMKAGKICYIPGIGIDLEKYKREDHGEIRRKKRRELQINDSTVFLLSVGELNQNKNHGTVIKALSELKDADYGYFICGEGPMKRRLQGMIDRYGLQEKIKLLGYCSDMQPIYQAADLFIFPSFREGLSAALMEAMASGLPVVCSNIRGNVDLIKDGSGGYYASPDSKREYEERIKALLYDAEKRKRFGALNQAAVQSFSNEEVRMKMREIYQDF